MVYCKKGKDVFAVNNDLIISQINSVYYHKTDHWSRDFFAPRRYDGIVLFTEGEIEYRFADRNVTAGKGDLLFLPGNQPYSGIRHTDNAAFYVLDFTCLDAYLDAPFVCKADADTESRFKTVLDAWECQKLDAFYVIKSFAYDTLCKLCRTDSAPSDTADRIVQYIADNLDDPAMSNQTICGAFYLSPSTLRRMTVSATGLTPGQLLTKMRIERAKNAIRYAKKPVKQIARECGFTSPYYFSRCFHEETGMSPTEFKRLFEKTR